jgi:hypothetical protein
MRTCFGFALLILLAGCAREGSGAGGSPADSVTVAPTTDSSATAHGAEGATSADSVMARDTASSM